MGVSISGQLTALLSALGLGLGTGMVYDCFRILRCRCRWRWLGGLLDFLFWLLVTLGLFLHAFWVTGWLILPAFSFVWRSLL